MKDVFVVVGSSGPWDPVSWVVAAFSSEQAARQYIQVMLAELEQIYKANIEKFKEEFLKIWDSHQEEELEYENQYKFPFSAQFVGHLRQIKWSLDPSISFDGSGVNYEIEKVRMIE